MWGCSVLFGGKKIRSRKNSQDEPWEVVGSVQEVLCLLVTRIFDDSVCCDTELLSTWFLFDCLSLYLHLNYLPSTSSSDVFFSNVVLHELMSSQHQFIYSLCSSLTGYVVVSASLLLFAYVFWQRKRSKSNIRPSTIQNTSLTSHHGHRDVHFVNKPLVQVKTYSAPQSLPCCAGCYHVGRRACTWVPACDPRTTFLRRILRHVHLSTP